MKIRLQLTNACNYDCVFCYKEGIFAPRERNLDLSDFKFLLDTAKDVGFTEVKLVGGEPTLYPHLVSLTKYASSLGFPEIRITTNGKKLGSDPTLADRLKDAGLTGVTFTVDSFKPEIYMQITRAKLADFNCAMAGLKKTIDVFKSETTMNTVVTTLNLEEMPKYVEIAKEYNLGVKFLEMLDEDKKAGGLYVPLSDVKKILNLEDKKSYFETLANEIFEVDGARLNFVNSCCARKECNVCRESYLVTRVTLDGKLKGCIANDSDETDMLTQIKCRDELAVKDTLLKAINNKKYKMHGIE